MNKSPTCAMLYIVGMANGLAGVAEPGGIEIGPAG